MTPFYPFNYLKLLVVMNKEDGEEILLMVGLGVFSMDERGS